MRIEFESKSTLLESIVSFAYGELSPLESLLMLTPMLERSLANVLATVEPGKKVPSLMRDLIVEPSLTKLWNSPGSDSIC